MDDLKHRKIVLYGFFLANLFLVTFAWWSGSGSLISPKVGGTMIAFGRLFGLYAELGIVLMMVLMGRILWIEEAFGHDNMNRLHRWIGYSLSVFLVGHPVLLSLGYGTINGLGAWHQFINFLSWEDVLKAVLGLGALLGVIFLSLPWIRNKLKYERWHLAHLLVYGAFIFVIGHQIQSGDLAGSLWSIYWYALNFGLLGLFGIYRVLRPLALFRKHDFRIKKVVAESPDSFSIYIGGKDLDNFHFKAGQFANFFFLKRGQWTPHPFSFSVSPNSEFIRVTAKALGDFTRTVGSLAPGTKVLIDGPLGRFTLDAAKNDKFLLVAGGIGVTPIRALAEELAKRGKDGVLLYSARTKKDLVFKEELEKFNLKKYWFLSEEIDPNYVAGRIDEERLKGLVPQLKEREVYVCGPVPMIKALTRTLLQLGVPKNQIHFEIFSY